MSGKKYPYNIQLNSATPHKEKTSLHFSNYNPLPAYFQVPSFNGVR